MPLVASTLMRYDPGGVEEFVAIFSVDVKDCPVDGTVMVAGLMDALGPAGETVADSLTAPAKPLRPFNVTMAVPLVPPGMVSDVGPDIPKSSGLVLTKISVAHESVSVPFVPLTRTV